MCLEGESDWRDHNKKVGTSLRRDCFDSRLLLSPPREPFGDFPRDAGESVFCFCFCSSTEETFDLGSGSSSKSSKSILLFGVFDMGGFWVRADIDGVCFGSGFGFVSGAGAGAGSGLIDLDAVCDIGFFGSIDFSGFSVFGGFVSFSIFGVFMS